MDSLHQHPRVHLAIDGQHDGLAEIAGDEIASPAERDGAAMLGRGNLSPASGGIGVRGLLRLKRRQVVVVIPTERHDDMIGSTRQIGSTP